MTDEIQQRRAERARKWERHLQSAALSLIVAGIVWACSTLVDVGRTQSAMAVQVGYLQAEIAKTYKADEARAALSEISRRMDAVERRVDMLERASRAEPVR